jgi:membrane protein YqaA with SNARE-associated domain
MEAIFCAALSWLALPQYGLSTIFFVAMISATLLPMGSEPAVFGFVKLAPDMFWAAVLVATMGNAIGGAINWWIGYGAKRAYEHFKHSTVQARALAWLERLGPKACFFAFLPLIGDPLTSVAGWLKLPFWPCFFWGAAGKFCRYVVMTAALIWVFPGQFDPAAFCER